MEYVSRREIEKNVELFKQVVHRVQCDCGKDGLAFDYYLVGSASHNLVVPHHNKGYDLDYQLFLKRNVADLSTKDIKDAIRLSFDRYMPESFDYAEDSTSAITIKKKKGDHILVSYDIVILRSNNARNVEILRRTGCNQDTRYIWNLLPRSTNFEKKLRVITDAGLMEELREAYYIKKQAKNSGVNYTDRKSFQLLNEALNEVLSKHNIHY